MSFPSTNPSKDKLPYGYAARNSVIRSYRRNAKNRSLNWELSLEDCELLFQSDCFYCGCPPANKHNGQPGYNGVYIYNGIDRMDNDKGYTTDNCVSCCGDCNDLKGARSRQEFFAKLTTILEYHKCR